MEDKLLTLQENFSANQKVFKNVNSYQSLYSL